MIIRAGVGKTSLLPASADKMAFELIRMSPAAGLRPRG
jgi:hypothetical protein